MMQWTGSRLGMAAFALVALGSRPAFAQTGDAKVTQFVPNGEVKPGTSGRPQGWDYTLSLNANFSLAHNSNVVGQLNGASFILGVGAVGTLNFVSGPHELSNALNIQEAFSLTPANDRVVKNSDLARLEDMYAYYFTDWAGAFGRLSFEAPLMETTDFRAQPLNFTVARLNGTVDTLSNVRSARLADPFQPLTLTQSLGLTLRPLQMEPATFTVRAGGGGRETFSKGVLINVDDAATAGVVELRESDNVLQGGIEVAAGFAGRLPEQRLTYGVDFGLLIPLANNDPAKRSAIDLARVGVAAGVTFSMFEWLGLTYQLRVLSDPQLAKEVQVQNNVFLTFRYDVIPPKKVEAPPVEDPVKQAEARIKAAEERASDAEARAKAAEERLKNAPPPTPEPSPDPAPTPQ